MAQVLLCKAGFSRDSRSKKSRIASAAVSASAPASSRRAAGSPPPSGARRRGRRRAGRCSQSWNTSGVTGSDDGSALTRPRSAGPIAHNGAGGAFSPTVSTRGALASKMRRRPPGIACRTDRLSPARSSPTAPVTNAQPRCSAMWNGTMPLPSPVPRARRPERGRIRASPATPADRAADRPPARFRATSLAPPPGRDCRAARSPRSRPDQRAAPSALPRHAAPGRARALRTPADAAAATPGDGPPKSAQRPQASSSPRRLARSASAGSTACASATMARSARRIISADGSELTATTRSASAMPCRCCDAPAIPKAR